MSTTLELPPYRPGGAHHSIRNCALGKEESSCVSDTMRKPMLRITILDKIVHLFPMGLTLV